MENNLTHMMTSSKGLKCNNRSLMSTEMS